MKILKNPTLKKDGFSVSRFESLTTPDFRAAAAEVYENLERGRNTKNKLKRGIAWGILAQDQFTWLGREAYWLPEKLNKEEKGNTRYFMKIPELFLRKSQLEQALREVFDLWEFPEPTSHRAYEVQLSALRYEPTLDQPALPSPMEPHQDLIDGTILVLNKTGDLVGGMSRLYSLDGEPLYEMNLEVGEGLSVKDSELLHQVSVMDLHPGADWRSGDRAIRDVLLVRFQPVGR